MASRVVFDRSQSLGDATTDGRGHIGPGQILFGALGVLFSQDVDAHLLPGKSGGGGCGAVGKRGSVHARLWVVDG